MQIILGMLIKGGTSHKILHWFGRVEEKTYTGLTPGQVCMTVKFITLNKLVWVIRHGDMKYNIVRSSQC
mgnify:FL=1